MPRGRGVDDVATRYAAHRLTLVRLGVLLGADVGPAEATVQRAFLRELRRGGRGDDGEVLASLTARVVAETRRQRIRRAAAARTPTLVGGGSDAREWTAGLSPALSSRQREVLVLALWAGLTDRQVARASGLRNEAVTQLRREAVAAAGRDRESAAETEQRLTETLEDLAGAVSSAELRMSFAALQAEDARLRARHRRTALWTLSVVAVTALVVAGAWLAGLPRSEPGPLPTPTTTTSALETTPLSSPALAPGERPRAAIPWAVVGEGWVAVAASAPADAVTTTLLLVSPEGTRYGVGTSPDGMTLQDISPDGRKALLAIGSEAFEWDIQAGTSRRLGAAYGWKTIHYAGATDAGYLLLWTDNTSQVRLEHWGTDGRLRASYPFALAPTAGSPGSPPLVVAADGLNAFVASRDGTVLVIDLRTDAVGSVPLPPGSTGCEPRDRAGGRDVLVVCRSGPDSVLITGAEISGPQPVPGVPEGVVGAWQSTLGTVIQRGDTRCSNDLTLVGGAGGLTRPVLTGTAAGLVPNQTVGDVLLLGGTRCGADGGRLVAYDLRSGAISELTGESAGGRTVRQAALVRPVG